jgi:hypothetical protein
VKFALLGSWGRRCDQHPRTADQFREELRHANDPERRYIINFDREKIFGAGVGHHSPIGGYLEEEDLVLVLDVNRAFQPWLIERERLFNAMDTLDGEKKRGLLLLEWQLRSSIWYSVDKSGALSQEPKPNQVKTK